MILLQVSAHRAYRAARVSLGQAAQVLTRTERPSRTREHDAAHRFIQRGRFHHFGQFFEHDIIESVQHFGPVHGNGQHAAISRLHESGFVAGPDALAGNEDFPQQRLLRHAELTEQVGSHFAAFVSNAMTGRASL